MYPKHSLTWMIYIFNNYITRLADSKGLDSLTCLTKPNLMILSNFPASPFRST
jgi:hypothetical protein